MRGNKLHRALDVGLGAAAIRLLSLLGRGAPPELRPDRQFRRILVIKLAALGDTVLLIPSLRALRNRYPGAEIGMVGTSLNRDLIAEFPQYVDRFFCFDVRRGARNPRYLLHFVRELRAGGWDLGIDFDQWPHVTPVLLRLAGIPLRVGFRTPSKVRHRLYTHTESRLRHSHEAENFFRLLGPLGIRGERPRLELPVRRELAAGCRAALRERGWNGTDPLVLVHPGCGHAHPRAWPLPSYTELCRRLAEAVKPFFLVTGAGSERALTEELAAALPGRSVALNRMTIPEFVAYLSLSRLVVSGNTGAMHLAAALDLSQVVLEGPNDPARWGPLNSRAAIVRSTCPDCPCLDFGWEFHRTDGYCMAQISVDEVHEAVVAQLEEDLRSSSRRGDQRVLRGALRTPGVGPMEPSSIDDRR